MKFIKSRIMLLVLIVIVISMVFYYKSSYEGSIIAAMNNRHIEAGHIYHIQEEENFALVFYGEDDMLSVGLVKKGFLGYEWVKGVGSKLFEQSNRDITIAWSNLLLNQDDEQELISINYGVIHNEDITHLKVKYKGEDFKEATIVPTNKGQIWFCMSKNPINYDPSLIGLSETGDVIYEFKAGGR